MIEKTISQMDRHIAGIQTGKLALIAYTHFSEVVNGMRQDLVVKMMNEHRLGSFNHISVASDVAVLSALDLLLDKLRKQIRKTNLDDKESYVRKETDSIFKEPSSIRSDGGTRVSGDRDSGSLGDSSPRHSGGSRSGSGQPRGKSIKGKRKG